MPPSLQSLCSAFITLVLLTCFLSPPTAVGGLCLANQSAALLKFKGGLQFQGPGRLSSWKDGSDCCNWEGVTCENATGFVVTLNLSGITAASPTARVFPSVSDFSPSLFDLQRLCSLDLSYNVFNGSIPTGFAKLQNLSYLNLSNSGFSDQVPAEISGMTGLVSLDLSSSYLRSAKFFTFQNPDFVGLVKKLSNLKSLRLDGVNISTSVGRCISAVNSSLRSLQILSLSGCSLSGSTDDSVVPLDFIQSISHLDLSRNNLFNVPKFLTNLTRLEHLGLSTCSLQGTFDQRIFLLPNLQVLDISNNPNLVGVVPDNFQASNKLQILSLSSTNLSGTIPDSLGKLSMLSDLTMSNCNFTGRIPQSLVNLTRLKNVDMSFNKLSDQIPAITAPGIVLLDLSSNKLTGPIPESFGQLNHLVSLILKDNLLTGYIPTGLLNLPNLTTLDLSQNNLTGYLSNFSKAASLMLETLELTNNSLGGVIPGTMASLSHIKVIALASNEFIGTIDITSFMSLKNLSRLDLSDNKLIVVSNDLKDADGFAQLTTLRLSSCNLTKVPKWIGNQNKLSILELGNNGISGDIPSLLTRPSLVHLNLSHNMFSSFEKPTDLFNMKSLLSLDLHSNRLSGDIPTFPPSAIFLDFSDNRFTSSIPVNKVVSLLYLQMANNSISGNIPVSLCNSTNLSVLDLSNNNLSGEIPSCLASSSELSVLNLRGSRLSSRIPDVFSGGCKLRTLNLNSNKLSGKLSRSLCSCSRMEVLDLGRNDLTDAFPSWLGCLNKLQVLALPRNHFYGSVTFNASQVSLQIIDVSGNNLSGILEPEMFKTLKAITKKTSTGQPTTVGFHFLANVYYQDTVAITIKGVDFQMSKITNILNAIDVSNNFFTGHIPEEIGALFGLHVLNMSHNHFNGSIPTSLGNLGQLESLDLSRNNLSGNIPPELSRLTFLAVLNLSFNNLQGRIPQVNQFNTFDATAFQGNPGLCGPPLKKNCTLTGPNNNSNISNDKNEKLELNYSASGFGFGVGVSLFAMPLLLSKNHRKWYCDHVDKVVVLLVFVPIDWLWSFCRKFKGDTAVKDDEFGSNEEEDESGTNLSSSNASSGHFCVFCTQLAHGATRAIHRECSCIASNRGSLNMPKLQSWAFRKLGHTENC